jgi:hypothetical protein
MPEAGSRTAAIPFTDLKTALNVALVNNAFARGGSGGASAGLFVGLVVLVGLVWLAFQVPREAWRMIIGWLIALAVVINVGYLLLSVL